MAIKLYYNINTFQYIGKVTGGETWVQGDDDSKELELYFGTGDLLTFVNGLTNVTVFDKNCRVSFTRPDDETATIGASQITSGSAGYYKIVIDSWVTNAEGTVELDTQRYVTDTSITAYGQATITVAEGTPSPDEGYALKTELNAVEAKADANTANKHNKSAIVTTTTEGDPTIDTEVNSTAKTAELLASNSSTDQAYTDTVTDDILDGTTAFTAVNLGTDGTTGVIDYDGTCRVLEVNLGNGVVQQIGEENFICATNKSGSQVTTPTVCEITGSTGNKVQFEVASNDGTPTGNIALATETIGNNASGKLTHFGLIRNVNTTLIAGSPIEGAVIYLGLNGGLTTIKPEAPNSIIRIGNIVTANASVGVIFVDIQRAGKFANQSDVYFNGGLSDGDLAQYVAANTRWEAINKADITVGKATADASGNVITTTYATKTELETAVTGLYDYKGTVATYADLPSSGQEVGDVYNVLNDENTGDTGVNYAWDGSAWDNIGGSAVTKVDKDLSGYTPVTASAVADDDNARVYLDNDGAERSMTLTEIYAGANTATGAFVASADYSADGLGSYKTAFKTIHQMALESTGKYYVNVKDIADNLWAVVQMPDTSTDTATTTQFSFDNKTTYRTLKVNDGDIAPADLSLKKIEIYRDGTTLILDDTGSVESTQSYTGRINSTIGEVAPLDGGTPELVVYGKRFNQVVSNGDFSNGTTDWSSAGIDGSNFTVVNGILQFKFSVRYGYVNQILTSSSTIGNQYYIRADIKSTSNNVSFRFVDSGTDLITISHSGNNTYERLSGIATVINGGELRVRVQDNRASDWDMIYMDNVMVLDLGTNPNNYTASDLKAMNLPYFEGSKASENVTVDFIGKNLNDEEYELGDINVTTGENLASTSKIRTKNFLKVKSGIDFIISGIPSGRVYEYDSNFDYLGTIGALNGTLTSQTAYLRFRWDGTEITGNEEIQLEYGTVATAYKAFKSQTITLNTLLDEVGTAQDKAYFDTNKWVKEANVETDTTVFKNENWIGPSLELTNTTLYYTLAGSVLNFKTPADDDTLGIAYLKIGSTEYKVVTANDQIITDEENTFSISSGGQLRCRVNKTTYPDDTDFEAYLQANDVEFIYELATPADPVEIDVDGNTYQEEVTTIYQTQDIPADLEVTWAVDLNKQVEILTDRANYFQKEIDDLENTANIITTKTLEVANWTGTEAPYSYALTVTGITSDTTPIVDLNLADVLYADIADKRSDWSLIYRVYSGTNTLIFKATEKPTVDLPITIVGVL